MNAAVEPQPARVRLALVFPGLMLVVLLAALDSTIVATALPTIVGELGGLQHLSWVVTAYLLAQTAVTPVYGKLGDLYGRKAVLQVAIVVFLAGSALCGISQSLTELIAFRVLQGMGGGGLIVSAQATIGDIVPPRERGRYQGIFGAVFGLASIAGPLLGGLFTTHASWRWIFYVNLPLGALALGVLALTLPQRHARVSHSIDYLGAGLLAGALSCVVLATSLGGTTYPWGSVQIVGLGVGALLLCGAFAAVERRVPEPILPLSLFSNRVFRVVIAISVIVGFAMFGAVTFLPLFLQVVNGASPTSSGLQLLPMMGGLVITAMGSGRLIARFGRYKPFPVVGTVILTTGLALLSRMDSETARATTALYMLIVGLGLGMVMPVMVLAAQNSVEYAQLGVATSGATLFRSMGGSVGVAVLGAIFANRLSHNIAHDLPGTAGRSFHGKLGGLDPSALHQLPAPLHAGFVNAFTYSLTTVFVVAAAVAAVGFALAWALEERPLRATVQTGGVPESLAAPRDSDSMAEMERALSVLAGREQRREMYVEISRRAGVDLAPGDVWVLARVAEHGTAEPDALGRRVDLDPAELAAPIARLRERKLLAADRQLDLTAAGRDALERLAASRRERMHEQLAGWSPEQHEELLRLIRRLSRDLLHEQPVGRAAPR